MFVACTLVQFVFVLDLSGNALGFGDHLIDSIGDISGHFSGVLLHQSIGLCDLLVIFVAEFCEFGHGEFQ